MTENFTFTAIIRKVNGILPSSSDNLVTLSIGNVYVLSLKSIFKEDELGIHIYSDIFKRINAFYLIVRTPIRKAKMYVPTSLHPTGLFFSRSVLLPEELELVDGMDVTNYVNPTYSLEIWQPLCPEELQDA